MAFRRDGLGCASCHGDQAQGLRGPRLTGGRDLEDFRRVHARGLFPPSVLSDGDFRAIDAWLKTLPRG
jgi:mono/diheme cytochrome c family protein